MSQSATTTREPAWSLIIGGGLGLIILGGLMVQMQFGGIRPAEGFATSSTYQSTNEANQLAAEVTQPSKLSTLPTDTPATTAPVINPFTPPAQQPDWLIAPCTRKRAVEVQTAWAEHLQLPIEITNRLGQRFRLIPPGIYDRGGPPSAMTGLLESMREEDQHWRDCLASSSPAHRVAISRPFYLSVNETTQQEFTTVMGRNPSWFASGGEEAYYVEQVKGEDTRQHPVEGVTWNDAREFATRLNEMDYGLPQTEESSKLTQRLKRPTYRLPTDAEWEHACRGGTSSPFSFGDIEPVVTGWFGEPNQGRTWRIGQGEANPLGLFGVHSGVWEWVEDNWSVEQYGHYREWPVHDPRYTAAATSPHPVRGGMWPDRRSRSFDRYAYAADFQTFFVGFRLAMEIEE